MDPRPPGPGVLAKAPGPNFFIVGAPKCGTTALYSYLRQHPDIFMPELKEPKFFATDLDSGSATDRRHFVRDWDTYLRLFERAGGVVRRGEASSLYLYSRDAARNIKQFCDYAKIIIMIREPVDLMYAFYSQRVFNGNEDIDDFEEALLAESARKQGRRIPRRTSITQALYYREVATLSPQLRRYQELFDPADIHFIVFDDFVRDTRSVFRSVLQFLEVDCDLSLSFARINSNKRVRSKALRNVTINPSSALLEIGRLTMPRSIRRTVLGVLRSVNIVEEPRPPMNPDLKRRLKEEFAPEVSRLSEILDRDLTAWSRT